MNTLARFAACGSLLVACAPTLPLADAGAPIEDGGASFARLELGTGAPSTWTPVTEGQTVFLQRGCQGAQHVFFSLRAWGVDVREAPTLSLSIVRARDGAVISSGYTLRLLPQSTGAFAEWTGLTPVVEEPSAVIGERAWMRASIRSFDGQTTVRDERSVLVVWGPDSCRPHG